MLDAGHVRSTQGFSLSDLLLFVVSLSDETDKAGTEVSESTQTTKGREKQTLQLVGVPARDGEVRVCVRARARVCMCVCCGCETAYPPAETEAVRN